MGDPRALDLTDDDNNPITIVAAHVVAVAPPQKPHRLGAKTRLCLAGGFQVDVLDEPDAVRRALLRALDHTV